MERWQQALADAQAGEDREKIAAAQRELRYWTARRATTDLQPPPGDCSQARFGCKSDHRARRRAHPDFSYRRGGRGRSCEGTISYVAPLARALIGKEVGDVVRVGASEAEIVAIDA